MNKLGKYGGIIAIEPNLEIGTAYKNMFKENIKVYRDLNTFVKDHDTNELIVGFSYFKPLILILETAFAQDLDHNLLDTPHRNNYPSRFLNKMSDEEIARKSLEPRVGTDIAHEIRNGTYSLIKKNTPIIFTTWMPEDPAKRELLTIPNTWYVQKEKVTFGNFSFTDTKKLYENVERVLEEIVQRR